MMDLVIFICFEIFRYDERLCPLRSVRLSKSKLGFGPENGKIILEDFVQKFENFHNNVRNI